MERMDRWYEVEIRGIDAVKRDGVWTWNESFLIEDDILWHAEGLTPRLILRQLRTWNYLSEASKGRVRVVDEGDLIEIQEKNTGRPILALLLMETPQPA